MWGQFIRDYFDGKNPKQMIFKGIRRIKPKTSEAVDGGVDTQLHNDRKEEVIRTYLGDAQVDLKPDTSDNYGGEGSEVSIEGEADKQMTRQERLDKQVADENTFPEDPENVTRRGLPPCKRVDDEGEEDHSRGRRK